MNREELRKVLEAEGVPSRYYSLSGGHPEDASVLDCFRAVGSTTTRNVVENGIANSSRTRIPLVGTC